MINIQAKLPTVEELIKFNSAINLLATGKMKYYVASEKEMVNLLEQLEDNKEFQQLAHQYVMFKSVEAYIKGNEDES